MKIIARTRIFYGLITKYLCKLSILFRDKSWQQKYTVKSYCLDNIDDIFRFRSEKLSKNNKKKSCFLAKKK